ncbi:MAG: Ig-like domain-containing protein [Hespellia sp.]|nr:Ig-like domain-containing protein [Hespellia sp.]
MKSNKKRIFSGTVAAACAAAMLMTGTFAWQAVANAVNPFKGTAGVGGNLHDDFDGSTTKKIYAENTGKADIYVRVQLSEFLKAGAGAGDTDITALKDTDYTLHIPKTSAADCGNQNKDADTLFHGTDYFKWTMGNDQATEEKSITGTTEFTGAASQTDRDNLIADALGSATVGNKADTSKSTETLAVPATQVLTMAQYKALAAAEKTAYTGWIYDTDGYAYWSKPLAAGASTGYLLNGVTIPAENTLDYAYAIKATMEYVDKTDLGAWTDGDAIKDGGNKGQTTDKATEDAADMLKGTTTLITTGQTSALTVGQNANAPAVTDRDGKDVTVTWASSDDGIVSVDEKTGKITGVKAGTATITGTAADGSTTSYEVTVTAENQTATITGTAPESVEAGKSVDGPSVTTTPEGTAVTWTSADDKIATVDPSTGKVTGVAPGKVTITATTPDGKGTVSYEITVVEPTSAIDEVIKDEVKNNDYTYAQDGLDETIKITQTDGGILTNINDMKLWFVRGTEAEQKESGYNVQVGSPYNRGYGKVELSALVADTAGVTVSSTDSNIEFKDGYIYDKFLPTYKEYAKNGFSKWHPTVTITLTKDGSSKDITIQRYFEGAIEDVTGYEGWEW